MNALAFLPTYERFLPFQTAALRNRMLQDSRLSDHERAQFCILCDMIATRFHFEFHRHAEKLKKLYDPFDPDRDTLPLDQLSAEQSQQQRIELCQAFRQLLIQGHYAELPRPQIAACAELQHFGGLKVEANLDDYADLAVFYRGAERQDDCRRSWHQAWRRHETARTVFHRAALLVRLAEQPGRIHLKLFKDIVAEDLEMILPEVRVRMRWVDGLKIGSGVAGSLTTAVWKAFTAALFSPWLFLIVFGTFLAAMIRASVAYMGSKTRYLQALSANLYFQNLANNASVLTCLVDAAEAEQVKETLLAYFILYVERDRDFSPAELDQRVRHWVQEQFGRHIDFEVQHALRTLHAKGLATPCAAPDTQQPPAQETSPEKPLADGRQVWKVYDLPSALRRLDKTWDGFYAYNSGQRIDTDHLAHAAWPPPTASSRTSTHSRR